MAELSTIFTNIANSIRNKAGITNTMLPSEMSDYIDDIEIPEPTKANMVIMDQGGYVTLSSNITCSISETE